MKMPSKTESLRSQPTGMQRQMPQPSAKISKLAPSVEATSKIVAGLKEAVSMVKETSKAVLKSRAKNPEKYRAYQREYMRKRRQKTDK